jgi:ribosomal protein S18 acetylase RimI-like enzyme
MELQLNYRTATIADLQQLKSIGILAYSQFSKVLAPDKWAIMESNLNNEERMIPLIEKSTVFVCTHNELIVGKAFLMPHGNPTDVYPADWCYIRMLGVHPDYRRKGIAKALTQLCIDEAIRTNEHTIALHTSEMMAPAVQMYEQLGFKRLREINNPFGVVYWLYSLELK